MFLGGRGSVLLSFPLALLVGGGFAGRGMGGGHGEVWRETPVGT